MHNDHVILTTLRNWENNGESLEQAIMRWQNCKHAEILESGEVYIEGPQSRRTLNDSELLKLIEWLRTEGLID